MNDQNTKQLNIDYYYYIGIISPMSPLKIKLGWFEHTLNNRWSSYCFPISDMEIAWGGDNPNIPGGAEAHVFKGQVEKCVFPLIRIGDFAEMDFMVRVPPIERGQESTVVKRTLRLERI